MSLPSWSSVRRLVTSRPRLSARWEPIEMLRSKAEEGEADAGQRGAIVYTIVESCRRRHLDPYEYLRDVLTRLPRMTNHQIPEVTPEAWSKARRQLQNAA
jgi:hypothetical protein